MIAALVPLVVLLPLLGAATALILGRHRRAQMGVSTAVLGAVVVIAAVLVRVFWRVHEVLGSYDAAGTRSLHLQD